MEVAQGIFGARQRVVNVFDAADAIRDPNIVHPVVREVFGLLRSVDLVPADEAVIGEKSWHDLTLLRVHAPVAARAVEDYRSAHARFLIWTEKALEVTKRSVEAKAVEIPLVVFTTMMAESTRRKLGLMLLEAHTAVVFEDVRANGSPGVRSLLDPTRYGFTRALPALNDEITLKMTEYASTVEAAEVSLKALKDLIAAIVKMLQKPD